MLTTPDFTTSESLASPNLITFTDVSIGVDNTLTNRKIYCRLANGNWLTTAGESTTIAYENWSYSDTSITLDLISQSTTSSVTVEWLNGSTVVYDKTELIEWDLYDYLFAFELIQSQTATPGIIQDSSYYSNFFQFITNLWASEASVTYGSDLYSSQAALNKNQNLINNSDLYF